MTAAASRRVLVFHPFLFSLHPVISLYANNITGMPAQYAVASGFACLAFGGVVWGLFWLLIKERLRTAIVASVFLQLFFVYEKVPWRLGGITIVVQWLTVQVHIGYCLLVLCFIGFVFYAKRKWRYSKEITLILNGVGIVLVLIPLIHMGTLRILHNHLWQPRPPLQEIPVHKGSAKSPIQLPNIYYIVMDAYGGDGPLLKFHGYDNTPFVNFLKEKGFYVARQSLANYPKTALSLNSTLNMNYIDKLLGSDAKKSLYNRGLNRFIRKNRVMEFLRERGYTTVGISTANDYELVPVDRQVPTGRAVNDFEYQLMKRAPITDLLRGIDVDLQSRQKRRTILRAFEALAQTTRSGSPIFVYAHLLIPHEPFVFGQNGEPRNKTWRSHASIFGPEYKKIKKHTRAIRLYIEQLIFANKLLDAAVTAILKNSQSPPIIIIQGDHGPRFAGQAEEKLSRHILNDLSILNAYYFPDQKYDDLYQDISPVNSFRVVLNKFFDADLPLLKDSQFEADDEPYELDSIDHLIWAVHHEDILGSEWQTMNDNQKRTFIASGFEVMRNLEVPLPSSQGPYPGYFDQLLLDKPEYLSSPLDQIFFHSVYFNEPQLRDELKKMIEREKGVK